MNHQWRYFYPNYSYGPYHDPQSSFNLQPKYEKTPASYPEKIQYKEHKPNIKYDSILKNIEKLNEKLDQLEEENKALQEEVENIKPLTIENINYKIQDLHVQDLSGNLMVGLTALSDAEELKKLLEENDPITFNEMNTNEFENAMMHNETMNDQDGEE
ncbi:hypothetical protein [Virgibacillus kimchii]